MISLGSETLAVAWELWPPGLLEQAARLVTVIRVANKLFMGTHLAADPSISVSKAKQSNHKEEEPINFPRATNKSAGDPANPGRPLHWAMIPVGRTTGTYREKSHAARLWL